MKRVMVWTLMLAVCLLFGSTAQAMTADETKLTALYNAIFVSDAEPVPADDDSDAIPENIWCCVPDTAACVSTSKEKCLRKVADDGYEGTVHATYLACKNAGCK